MDERKGREEGATMDPLLRKTTDLLLSVPPQAEKDYHRRYRQTMERLGLTDSEWDVLLILFCRPAVTTAAGIARVRGISKSLVCKSVERLWERGLLRKEPSTIDRRQISLMLTDSGRTMAEEIDRLTEEYYRGVLRGISMEELLVLSRVLQRLELNLLNNEG